MAHIGIDLEQFVSDPMSSGIQRVLLELARQWPQDEVSALFVVPYCDGFLTIDSSQASELIGLAFQPDTEAPIADRISRTIGAFARNRNAASTGELMAMFSSWLLPEVSYLPSVLERAQLMMSVMPTTMIGYDVLPMSHPENYRHTPRNLAHVSRYFQLLCDADRVVCISDYAKSEIVERLRRSRLQTTVVASPGGDHVPLVPNTGESIDSRQRPIRLLRLGTLEARKKPVEILTTFEILRTLDVDVELTFVGAPSSSDSSINAAISDACSRSIGITWIQQASDPDIVELMRDSDLFLSLGTEGFGIPVLEALRSGTPVVYHGIQPAAEIMQGKGARRLENGNPVDLAPEIRSLLQGLPRMREEIDASAIPLWRDFIGSVAKAAQ